MTSFFDLPRELRDSIYQLALDARVHVALVHRVSMPRPYDPPWQKCHWVRPAVPRHDLWRDREAELRLRCSGSAMSLLRVSKAVAAEVQPWLCDREISLLKKSFNPYDEGEFMPSAYFVGMLRRGRFYLGTCIEFVADFFSKMPTILRKHIQCVVLTESGLIQPLDRSTRPDFEYLPLWKSVPTDEKYNPLTKLLLQLPELKEVYVYVTKDHPDDLYQPLAFQELLHVLYWGRLQCVHMFTGDHELNPIWEKELLRVIRPVYSSGEINLKPMLLDVLMAYSGLRPKKGPPTEDRVLIAGSPHVPPSPLISFKDEMRTVRPNWMGVWTLTRRTGSRGREHMPPEDAPPSVWAEYFKSLTVEPRAPANARTVEPRVPANAGAKSCTCL